MPNRIIKESIKRSPEIDRLSWFEEVVFYRLLVTADDYGRLDGRPIVLKNDLFPTKDTVTKKAVEDAIAKLVSVGLLVTYVDPESNMPLLALRKWEKHQTIRNKYSRYPAPPEDVLTADCKQLQSDCKQTSANCTDESESNIESNPNQNSVQRKRFTPPTTEQVADYCREKGYPIDAARFVDYYTSKGWRVGQTPMKDWQAAVRNWAKRACEGSTSANPAMQFTQRDYGNTDLNALIFGR